MFNPEDSDVYKMCEEMQEEYLIQKNKEFGDKLQNEAKLKELIGKFKKVTKTEIEDEEIKYLEPKEFTTLVNNIKILPPQYLYGVIEIISMQHPEYNFNKS